MKLQLLALTAVILILGCASNDSKWSNEVNALGEPTYDEIENFDFGILPFPGLEYVGPSGDYEAFYGLNDSNFAIYAEVIIYSANDYSHAKQLFYERFGAYPDFECNDINSNDWITQAQVFECEYSSAELNTSFKSAVFYKGNEFIHTTLSVWGDELSEYEYIFDEFNQKAIVWE